MKTLIATLLLLLSAGVSLAQSCATCGASCACSSCPCPPAEQVSVPQGVRYVYVTQARTCSNGVCTQQVVAFAVPDDAKPSAPAPKPAAPRAARDDQNPDYPDYEPTKPVVPFRMTFDANGKPIIEYGSFRESQASAPKTSAKATCNCAGKLPCECGESCRCVAAEPIQFVQSCPGGNCPATAKPAATPATFPKSMPGPGVTTTVETTKTRTSVLEGRHPLRRTFGSVGRFFFPWR